MSEIWNMTKLKFLSLYYNQLTGSIPSDIENLSSLTHLYLMNNQLSGILPNEVCEVGDSTNILSNNLFCPPYPSCIENNIVIGDQDTSNCN